MANGKYKNLNNKDYWIRRSEERVSKHWLNEENVEKRLIKEYRTASTAIKKEVSDLYSRFAIDNKLSYVDAIKKLSTGEMKDYLSTMESTRDKMKLINPDSPLLDEMDRLLKSTRINRLQSAINQIESKLLELGVKEQLTIEDTLYRTYEDNYYQSVYETFSGTGIGVSFTKLNHRAIQTAITMPWSGDMFSDSIWDNKRLLLKHLRQTITQGVIRGESYQKMASNLNAEMSRGYKNSLRIIRTETAHVIADSTGQGYDAAGFFSQYIVIATLDNRTSNICQKQDTKVYELKDRTVGLNYPPFHPNCRTTTSAYFNDGEDLIGTRIARGEDGTNYKVPKNMNYKEWKAKYVD